MHVNRVASPIQRGNSGQMSQLLTGSAHSGGGGGDRLDGLDLRGNRYELYELAAIAIGSSKNVACRPTCNRASTLPEQSISINPSLVCYILLT